MEDKINSYKNEVLGLSLRAYIDKNNTVWFKRKDVASSLGYAKPRNAILAHVVTEYIRQPSETSLVYQSFPQRISRNLLTQYGYQNLVYTP